MAKKEKFRIKRRVSTCWLIAFVVVFMTLVTLLSSFAMLDMLSEDIEQIGEISEMDESLKILLFPFILLIYICIGLFLMIKNVMVFAPSLLMLGFLIATAAMLSANAQQGKYCYKYSYCRSRANAAAIMNLVLCVCLALYFFFFFDWFNSDDQAIIPLYRYTVLAGAVICSLTALFIYLDKNSGIRQVERDNEISEEEENAIKQAEFEQKRAEIAAQNANTPLNGVAPHLTEQTLSARRKDD